eukprot:gene7889-biopygen6088
MRTAAGVSPSKGEYETPHPTSSSRARPNKSPQPGVGEKRRWTRAGRAPWYIQKLTCAQSICYSFSGQKLPEIALRRGKLALWAGAQNLQLSPAAADFLWCGTLWSMQSCSFVFFVHRQLVVVPRGACAWGGGGDGINQEPRRRVPQSSAEGVRGSALPRALRTAPWLN